MIQGTEHIVKTDRTLNWGLSKLLTMIAMVASTNDDGDDDDNDCNHGHLEGLNQSLLVYEPSPASVDDTVGRTHLRFCIVKKAEHSTPLPGSDDDTGRWIHFCYQ